MRLAPLVRPRNIEPRSPAGWFIAALAAVVSVPVVVATMRALADGWLAVGDNGNFLIRSRDVLTSNNPLLGTWSSASTSIGHDVNHPGPLLFDLVALPSKIADSGGLAVGVMLLHVACVALIALFAWRAGGARLATGALAAAAALSWTMGSELLYDPWNPHVLLLPFLLLLVLAVDIALGDAPALPVAAAVGSVIVQTHLSYALLVPPVGLLAVGLLVRRRGARAIVRPVVIALAVGALCWAQPVADQINGEGNLTALARGLSTDSEKVGAGLGLRIAADVVSTPPFWARGSFADAVRVPRGQGPLLGDRPNVAGLPSAPTALVTLAIAGVVLALAFLRARRWRDGVAATAVLVAGAVLALGVIVTIRLPVGGVGVPPHQVRYLWPIAAFATATAAVALVPARWTVRVLATAASLLAVLTIPSYDVPAGPQDDRDAIPVVRELATKLGPLEDEGTLLFDTSGSRFAEPWTSAVLAVLQEQHIPFTVDDDVWERQLGVGRADDGDADARIFLREGDAARTVPAGTRRIAFVDGLSMDAHAELSALERALVDVPIVLNEAGAAALSAGALPDLEDGVPSAEALLAYGGLSSLLRDGLLVVPPERADDLERYADLRYRADRHTLALFLDPTPYR